jgi:hypothetical protein
MRRDLGWDKGEREMMDALLRQRMDLGIFGCWVECWRQYRITNIHILDENDTNQWRSLNVQPTKVLWGSGW